MYYAYIHCKPDGTPFYVGKGNSRRVREVVRKNKFHSDVCKKYGYENILVGKLDCSSEEIAFDLEKGLIKCLKRMGVRLANQTDGGEGASGWVASEEFKQRKSQNMLGEKNHFYGKKHSPDVIKMLSDKAIKEGADPEKRRARSEKGKEWVGEKNPFFGKKHTEESKRKNAESRIGRPGRKMTPEMRKKCSEMISGDKHHFYGKKLSDVHIEKLSIAAKKQSTGCRFMLDLDGKLRRVLKVMIDTRLSEGWKFSSNAKRRSRT